MDQWVFSHARWDLDSLGLLIARLVVSLFVPAGAPIVVAVDDTPLHRYGRLVHGAAWQHDGSARGRDGIGRGNCFVIAGLVVDVPFMGRGVLLPVLFRLHIPKQGPSKTEQARQMVNLLARAFAGRIVHVVADALYRGPARRNLPGAVTFTTRLHATAVLYAPPAPPSGRLGTAGQLLLSLPVTPPRRENGAGCPPTSTLSSDTNPWVSLTLGPDPEGSSRHHVATMAEGSATMTNQPTPSGFTRAFNT